MRKDTTKILSLVLFLPLLAALLLFSGCAGSAPDPTPSPAPKEQPDDLLPVMIMAEGTLYQHDVGVLDSSVKIEDSQILGYITKDLANEIPTQDGEACWVKEGTPYARCPLEEYPEGMVALIARQWWIFLPARPAPSHPPDKLPILMMAEGVLYQHDVGTLDSSIKIEDSQILGYITKDYANTIPVRDGEACGVEEGTPYARCPLEEYPEGMVARVTGNEWWIFLPEAQVRLGS